MTLLAIHKIALQFLSVLVGKMICLICSELLSAKSYVDYKNIWVFHDAVNYSCVSHSVTDEWQCV